MSCPYSVNEEVQGASLVILKRTDPSEFQYYDAYLVRMLCCGDVRQMTRQQIIDRSKRNRSACSACMPDNRVASRMKRAASVREVPGMDPETVWVGLVPWPPLGKLGPRNGPMRGGNQAREHT